MNLVPVLLLNLVLLLVLVLVLDLRRTPDAVLPATRTDVKAHQDPKHRAPAGFRTLPRRGAPWGGWRWLAFGLVLAASVVFPNLALAQRVEGTGLRFPEYYDPPNERQLKSLVEGARAQPLEGGRVLFTDAKVQTFRTNGQPEMIVEAPECVYDPRLRAISSTGSLRVRTADAGFSIAGEGFSWETNSALIISNRVRTTIQPALLQPRDSTPGTKTAGAPEGPLEILADQFQYVAKSGLGAYLGHVRVTGTNNLALTSGSLKAILPLSDRQLESVIAETNVVVQYEDIHALGDRAVYEPAAGVARITGHPSWRAGPRSGSGEELSFDRTNRALHAIGHAWLKMPSQRAGGAGFLPGTTLTQVNPGPVTNRFVEVFSDRYELKTNEVFFRSEVRVEDRAGGDLLGRLTCDNLTAWFAGTNELQRLEADGRVFIEQVTPAQTNSFASGRAVYSATNGLLELRDHPSWREGRLDGKGDLIVLSALREEVTVSGAATMRLPTEAVGPNPATDTPKGPAALSGLRLAPGTNQFAQISADKYTANKETAVFRGHVEVQHPRMYWRCGRVTVQLPATGGKIESILAEESVVFDLADEQRKMRGTGDQAHYTYSATSTATNEQVELTGNPMLESTNGTIRGPVLLLDLVHNRLVAPGRYQIHGVAPPPPTNRLTFPKK